MSTTSQRSPRNARLPKLRLSCDSCASAKVRCSRDQPQCERCVSNDLTCVYGPSRRSGKPPRDPNRKAASRSEVDKLEPGPAKNQQGLIDAGFMLDNVQSGHNNFNLNNFGASPSWSSHVANPYTRWNDAKMGPGTDAFYPGSTFPPMDDSMFASEALASGQTSGYSTDTSSSTPWQFDASSTFSGHPPSSMTLPAMDFQDQSHPLSTDQSGNSSTIASSVALSSDSASLNPRHLLSRSSASTHNSCGSSGGSGGGDCYSLAYSTLASLHFQRAVNARDNSIFSFSLQSQPRQAPPALDSVLSNNKTAINNVLQLLNCPCAAHAHMALLYASITSKILIWYQIAAGLKVSSSSPTADVEHAAVTSDSTGILGTDKNSTTSTAINAQYTMGSTFTDEPVKIGSFSPDEEYQAPMRQVLLLGELSKAAVLIDALSRMNGRGNSNEQSSSRVVPTGSAKNLYATLGSWLKAELARTIEEVKSGSRMQLGL